MADSDGGVANWLVDLIMKPGTAVKLVRVHPSSPYFFWREQLQLRLFRLRSKCAYEQCRNMYPLC